MEEKSDKQLDAARPSSADATREERIGRRLVGLSRAMMELTPPMEWIGLMGYLIQPSDVGRTLSNIIQTRVDERVAEIERERDDEEGPRS